LILCPFLSIITICILSYLILLFQKSYAFCVTSYSTPRFLFHKINTSVRKRLLPYIYFLCILYCLSLFSKDHVIRFKHLSSYPRNPKFFEHVQYNNELISNPCLKLIYSYPCSWSSSSIPYIRTVLRAQWNSF
jgi:hypothetical protein